MTANQQPAGPPDAKGAAPPSGAAGRPVPRRAAASGFGAFVRRQGLRIAALGALAVHVLLLLVAGIRPGFDIAATVSGFVVVPLLAWELCRDIDRGVLRLLPTGFVSGLLRAVTGVGLIVLVPLLFNELHASGEPVLLRTAEVLAVVLPVTVAAGLVLLGVGAADVLYALTRGFSHLSTRLMLLLVVSALGTVAWLSYVGPEGRRLLLWAVERGHLQDFVAPLETLERYAGDYVGGIAGAIGLQLPFVLLLAWRFGRNATDDLTELARAFQRVAQGNLDEAVPVRGKDEVATMKRGFNQMLVLARERRFLETAFGRYLSPVLLDRLRADREHVSLHSECRTASVLFADIRGFTALSAELSPEEVIGLLNRYVAVLIETVAPFEGYINKFVGDAVLVVWNAPLDQPDHVARAVRCAAAMQQAIADANAAGAFGAHTIGMGVGINSGPLVMGQLGNERQAEFTVLGDTVNVASRACGLATPGQITMTAAVRDLYLGIFPEEAARFASLGPREIKGKGQVDIVAYT